MRTHVVHVLLFSNCMIFELELLDSYSIGCENIQIKTLNALAEAEPAKLFLTFLSGLWS